MRAVSYYIKVAFYAIILFLVIKMGMVVYYKFFSGANSARAKVVVAKFDLNSFNSIPSVNTGLPDDGYNFKKMLSLIDACEKVRYIEHLQFSRPGEIEKVDTQTLKALAVALKQEKRRLKQFICKIRSHSRQTVPSKRMNALRYYMRVIELNMQDVEEIVCMRTNA